jgi:hypothetical protein
MKRQLQAGLVAILLLLAFACTKESNSPQSEQSAKSSQLSSSQSSEALQSKGASSADQSVANLSATGVWILHYSWGCTGSYGTTTLTVYADGTYKTGSGYTGQWISNGYLLMFHYNGLNTTYTGYASGSNFYGIMATFKVPNSKGCFYLSKPAATTEPTENRIKGQPDASGKQ